MPVKKNKTTRKEERKSGGEKEPAKAKESTKITLHTSRKEKEAFYIVGLGASAGGLEAFEQFFANMSADSGMAFILVPHLDPTHISILPDLIQKYTRMNVLRVKDRMKVEPNSVYIIPPNKDMAILHRTFQLIELTETIGPCTQNVDHNHPLGKLFYLSLEDMKGIERIRNYSNGS